MSINLFNLDPANDDLPNAAALAEDIIAEMVERAGMLDIDAGDTAAFLALELIARLALYERASLAKVLKTLSKAAPTRLAVLRDAQRRGEPMPPLSSARLDDITSQPSRLN